MFVKSQCNFSSIAFELSISIHFALNLSTKTFKVLSSKTNKFFAWFVEEIRFVSRYIISLRNLIVNFMMSLNSFIIECLMLIQTLWKRFIQINCCLIEFANLALYSNKYSRFMNEIRLSFMIFLTYSFKSFKCKSTRKNLFFFLWMFINELTRIAFFKSLMHAFVFVN
jgi:hypothetical protein